jgi:hypothetical protein
MLSNIKKYNFDQNFLIKILFSIFPLIMLMPSGYINLYLVFFIIYSYTFLFINKIKIKIFFIDYLIFIFFISSIISTILGYSNSNYIIIAKSFADIRFALLFLLIRNLFYCKIIKINTLLITSLICVIFLSFDIFLQFTYGKDILGYSQINGRYAGTFGDEAIAGSYIQKFSIFAILATFFLRYEKIQNKKILIIPIVCILGAGILMTLDRIPFFIFILSLFSLLILLKNFRIVFFFSILIMLIFFLLMFKNNNLIQNRYQPVFKLAEIVFNKGADFIKNDKTVDEKTISIEQKTMQTGIEYYSLFNSAIYVFKNNFWIGTGSKSYYKSCNELIKYRKYLLCAPHPHNIYLEILINQGIIGMIIFLTYLTIIFKSYYSDLIISKTDNNKKILKISFLVLLTLEILPLRSYGSIFQTVNGTLFWFIISLVSSKSVIK